jgi:serine/threonine protein kinase
LRICDFGLARCFAPDFDCEANIDVENSKEEDKENSKNSKTEAGVAVVGASTVPPQQQRQYGHGHRSPLDGWMQGVYGGKLKYKSPELFACGAFNAYAADVYACGIILFMLAVGMPPYNTPHSSDALFRRR